MTRKLAKKNAKQRGDKSGVLVPHKPIVTVGIPVLYELIKAVVSTETPHRLY